MSTPNTRTVDVTLTVGGIPGNLGALDLDPTQPVGPQVADMLRAAADEFDDTAEEVTPGEPA